MLPLILCVALGAMSIGGIYLSALPLASVTFILPLAFACSAITAIRVPGTPALFHGAILLFTILLSVAIARQAHSFDARVRAGPEVGGSS